MKPILKFTGYTEWRDEFKVDLTLKAEVNGKKFEGFSPAISIFKETDAKLDSAFVNMVDDITREAMDYLIIQGIEMMDPRNMTVSDRLSQFEVKQTVEFNNNVNEFYRDIDIILGAIW